MNKKLLVGVGVAASLFGVAACGEPASEDVDASEQTSPPAESSEQPEMPEPDLEGIPDVVAEVNGEEISKDDFVLSYQNQFQQRTTQAQMSGQQIDQDELKNQIAESMVGTELLVQAAESRDYEVSQGDLDSTLAEIAESSGMESAEDFLAATAEQGMDEAEVMSEVRVQVQVDRLVAEEAGDTSATEEELQALYDQAIAQQEAAGGEGAEVPAFEEVRPQLEQQVEGQKEAEAVQALVAELREDADVTVHL